MGSFGGYYKGEKRKAKKGKEVKSFYSTAPTFAPPSLVPKKKRES